MAVTLGPAALAIRDWLLNGAGEVTDVNALFKALSGDIVLKCTPATGAIPADSTTVITEVVVTLETAAGEIHRWYNGPVTLAVSDDGAGDGTIDPAAGAHVMVDGELTVEVTKAGAFTAGQAITVTASIAAQHSGDTAILGYVVANKTCVLTAA